MGGWNTGYNFSLDRFYIALLTCMILDMVCPYCCWRVQNRILFVHNLSFCVIMGRIFPFCSGGLG